MSGGNISYRNSIIQLPREQQCYLALQTFISNFTLFIFESETTPILH